MKSSIKFNGNEIITLKNGLKLIFSPKPKKSCISTDEVHVGFYVFSGVYTESPKNSEYSHILEHIMAQFPSEKYPDSRNTNLLLERYGVSPRGTVDEYVTHVWLEGLKQSIDVMIDVFINGIFKFQVDENVFEQEKIAAITELTEKLMDPHLDFIEYINKSLFPNHPISRPMKVHIASAKKASPRSMESFFKKFLNPDRMVVYIAGNTPDKGRYTMPNIKRFLSDVLSNLPRVSNPSTNLNVLSRYRPRSRKSPGIYYMKNTAATVTTIHYVWLTNVKHREKDTYVLDAIQYILRDILFDELRTQKGLIYTIKVDSQNDPINRKLSYIEFNVDVINKRKLIKVLKEFNRIIRDLALTISEDDVLQYRRKLYRQYQSKFSDCSVNSKVKLHAKDLLFDSPISTPDEELQKYLTVSRKDIAEVIKKKITTNKLYTFYCGKYKVH